MKKSLIILSLIVLSGCAHGAYKPQTIQVRAYHTLVLHESRVSMENEYERVWLEYQDKSSKRKRGTYGGFFDPNTNTSHCSAPYPESCMLHEYKHQMVKYGLIVPDDPHFKSRTSKTLRIIKWR